MTKPTVTQNLMRMLDLSPVEAAPASFGSDEVLSGVTLTREQPRTFGGQVLAGILNGSCSSPRSA